jgi:hypothetical protein
VREKRRPTAYYDPKRRPRFFAEFTAWSPKERVDVDQREVPEVRLGAAERGHAIRAALALVAVMAAAMMMR